MREPEIMTALRNRKRFDSYLAWTVKAYRAGLWTLDDRYLWRVVRGWSRYHGIDLPVRVEDYRAPFKFDKMAMSASGFLSCLVLLRTVRARGRWNDSLEQDWSHLVQWGWLLGISLPENVEEYR